MMGSDEGSVAMDEPRESETGRRSLEIYLRDHRAGAHAGLALVGRLRRANRGTPLGDVLDDIEAEIGEDRSELGAIMDRLGVAESQLKKAGAKVAELVARLKSLGQLARSVPPDHMLELEGLLAGIDAKGNLWSTLQTIAPSRPELDEARLEHLVGRAASQRDRIRTEHRRRAATAFGDA